MWETVHAVWTWTDLSALSWSLIPRIVCWGFWFFQMRHTFTTFLTPDVYCTFSEREGHLAPWPDVRSWITTAPGPSGRFPSEAQSDVPFLGNYVFVLVVCRTPRASLGRDWPPGSLDFSRRGRLRLLRYNADDVNWSPGGGRPGATRLY